MVTDEQVKNATEIYSSSDVAHSQLAAIRKVLENYEQSKMVMLADHEINEIAKIYHCESCYGFPLFDVYGFAEELQKRILNIRE